MPKQKSEPYVKNKDFFEAMNVFLNEVDQSYKKAYGKVITWRADEFEESMSYDTWISTHTTEWLENYYKSWFKSQKDSVKLLLPPKEEVMLNILYPKWYDSEVFRLIKEERNKQWDGKPVIPRYIGECFLKIANHLSFKPNFVNYMYREDMISDGIENCVQYVYNFNNRKSDNPFAYFTQIIWYAFVRRITKEKKQLDIKNKIVEKSGYEHLMHTDDYGNDMSGMNKTYSDMTSIKENIEVRMENR